MGMTELEVREYLRSIKFLSEKRDRLYEQVEELRSVATNCVARTDKDPIQTSGSGDKMSNILGKAMDILREADAIDEKIRDRVSFVMRMTENLTENRHKKYLITRYVEKNGFYDTVMLMDLTDSTARRIEKKSISELTRIINQNLVENPTKFPI